MKKFKETVVKALLPQIILTEASHGHVHGYGIIALLRKKYGVYLGPSTVYPELARLEHEGLIRSEWNFNGARPRKVYSLTAQGERLLRQNCEELVLLNRKLAVEVRT